MKHIESTKRNELQEFKLLRQERRNFNNVVHVDWKRSILDNVYANLRRKVNHLQQRLDRKLNMLIEDSNWTKHATANNVVNISSKVLSIEPSRALTYGMSFSINKKPSEVDIGGSILQLEKHSNIPRRQLDILRGIVYGAANTHQ